MASAVPSLPRRLLFVGNSLTYCNDLDLHVKAFMEGADPGAVTVVDRVVKGGAPLKALWRQTEARQRIAAGGYDAVVLQEDLPETDVAAFRCYALQFHEAIRATGASTVLLMAWPYKRLGWISTEGIAAAHWQIAGELEAAVAPAGLAWQRAQEMQIKLYAEDGEHPNASGTYLAAATVFATLWRRSPLGLTCSAARRVDARRAERLQRLAWETVEPLLGAAVPTKLPPEPTAAGDGLVAEVFSALDADGNGRLNVAEFGALEEFVGFRGSAAARSEEFAVLCAECGCSPNDGLHLEGFRQLVDRGTEQGLFCTHCTAEELRELLADLAATRTPGRGLASGARRVIIVPGNGGGSIWDANWYGWLARELQKQRVDVRMQDMPDPICAREARWLPFIVERLAGGARELEGAVVVGHSSGAAAAMRLAEAHRIHGMVLVAAYTSDLGDCNERKSGYFSRPWAWQKQQDNCGFIVQFASTDDPFLPIDEQRAVREGLSPKVEYLEFDHRLHFFSAPFWELLDVLQRKLGIEGARDGS